ncbi:hypothetical protein Moror_7045 [Moniliophthora roreri MCA 2997]|nr:hypothetical protein Moror_7045 [Moniliophthora roreri MCA 2997]
MTPGVSSPNSPPNPELSRNDSPLPLMRPPNPQLTTPSFILTPLLIPMSNLRLSPPITLPPENPHLQTPLTPAVFRCLRPQFHPKVKIMPTVSREVPSEAYKDKDKDKDKENRTPSNDDAPPTMSLRPPTPVPTPMTQLVDHVSALCVDWNAISPAIAHSTCVADASKLSLSILLETALTNEGLATLHVEGLVRVQTLCRIITIMTMNLTTTTEENTEESVEGNDRDMDFLFVGADLRKVE